MFLRGKKQKDKGYRWEYGFYVVKRDMTTPHSGFKCEVGKEYVYDEEIYRDDVFEFFDDIDAAFKYYPVKAFKYRYFEVEAFGKSREENLSYRLFGRRYSKRIKLLEELSFDEIRDHMSNSMRSIIQSENEYLSINSFHEYREFAIEKCLDMLDGKYTDNYSRIVITRLLELDKLSMDKIEYMIALRNEGASTDSIVQIVNGFFNIKSGFMEEI